MTEQFNAALKQKIYEQCIQILEEKNHSLKSELDELTDALKNDTKSSMGDKHETSRAMNQLEQEKISNQLRENINQLELLQHLDITHKSSTIINGCLVKSNRGLIFIAVGLGKINMGDESNIIVSIQSPLGRVLEGKKVSETVEVNGIAYKILDII